MKGSYAVGDDIEGFSCGSGPAGWRYVGTRAAGDSVDLTVDTSGRVLRLLVEQDGWVLRGGSAGQELVWLRGEDEHRAVAVGFAGSSPAFDLVVARMLALSVGSSQRVTLVEVCEPVAATRTVVHAWARTACEESGVDRYEVTDLDTADRWVLHLSGEVLVSREGASDRGGLDERAPAHLLALS